MDLGLAKVISHSTVIAGADSAKCFGRTVEKVYTTAEKEYRL